MFLLMPNFHNQQQYIMIQALNKEQIASRLNTIKSMRLSLQRNPILSKNTIQMENKMQKLELEKNIKRNRRISMDLGQTADSSFMDEDEGSENDNLNSFCEKYILGQKIGEGANGAVYKCIHKKNEREYAVKSFKMDEDEHLLELKRNFVYIKDLRCSSLIKYKALYFDFQKHLTFLVMEYVPFQPLMNIHVQNEKNLKLITQQLISALKYLHGYNICHRDIKPDNILYDPITQQIKIIDFGISKKTFLRGTNRDMLTIIGTSGYLAPEMLQGGGYDERVDIWALGITLYKLITGYTPFQAQYHCDTIENIIKCDPKFDQFQWKSYSPQVKDFIFKLLKKVDSRMTIAEAEIHRFLKGDSLKNSSTRSPECQTGIQKMKFKRNESFTGNSFNESQSERMIKEKHARPTSIKRRGNHIINENDQGDLKNTRNLIKIVSLVSEKEFDLIESEDEDFIVTPKSNQEPLKNCWSNFQEFISPEQEL